MKTSLVWHAQAAPSVAAASTTATPTTSPAHLDGPCHCLCYSPDGARIVAGVGARVLVYEADGTGGGGDGSSSAPSASPSPLHSLRGHAGPVLAVAHAGLASGAGGRFASGDATGTVVVWTGSGQPVLRYAHGAAAAASGRGAGAVAAAGAPPAQPKQQQQHEPILALAWSLSPLQPRLASVSPTELALWDPGAAREVVRVPLGGGGTAATRAAAWSPRGGRVLALGLLDGSLSLRDGCAGGVELLRVRLPPGPGGAPAASVLALAWLRWESGGSARSGRPASVALAVSTADGRLHEVVLPKRELLMGGRSSSAARSWPLAAAGGWWRGNAVSLSPFSPGPPAADEEEGKEDERAGDDDKGEEDAGSSPGEETLVLVGGACGRVSLVAWRPPADAAAPPTPSSPPPPFIHLGPFWWGSAADDDGGSQAHLSSSNKDSPVWVWALAQRPGGCAYSSTAAAVQQLGRGSPPSLPAAHVAIGRHDGSVSIVAAHLPTVHALHLSGEHGHVYAAREGLTSVSVLRLRVVASSSSASASASVSAAMGQGQGTPGVARLRFGELVHRVGVCGSRVAVQLRGRVEVFERQRRAVGGGGGGGESSSSNSSGGEDEDEVGSAWSEEEDEEEEGTTKSLRKRWRARGGDSYALVATLVPEGAERLLQQQQQPPLLAPEAVAGRVAATTTTTTTTGSCSLLVVTARHVVLCSGARMAAYAAGAGGGGAGAGNSSAAAQPPQQQQPPEHEWAFDSPIRYVRAAGGPIGRETLLVGLRSGAVAVVFADRPEARLLVPAPASAGAASSSPSRGVRCLDLSADRLRLAVVDDSGTCSVYEPFGPDRGVQPMKRQGGDHGGGAASCSSAPTTTPVWRVRGADSCAWSDAHPDVLAVSGGGQLAVHFVPLQFGADAGAAALAWAGARAAAAGGGCGDDGGGGGDSDGGNTSADDDDPRHDDPAAARRRAAAFLAVTFLEEGRLVSPPLVAPPPSTQCVDGGGGWGARAAARRASSNSGGNSALVVGLAGATAYVLVRAAAPSSDSASSTHAGPALAALTVHLGPAVRHLARQRAPLLRSSRRRDGATAVAAPALAAARAVACLGASRDDWRLLAAEALDALDLDAAAAAFARLRDARGAALVARLAAAEASGAAPPGALRAEVAAWGGRLGLASRLFCRAGCPSEAVEMWLAMGRLAEAREVARGGAVVLSPSAKAALPAAEAAAARQLQRRQQQQQHVLLLDDQRRRRTSRRRRRQRRGHGDEKEGGHGSTDDVEGEDAGDDDDDESDGSVGRDDARAGDEAASLAAAQHQASDLLARGEIEQAAALMIERGLWEQLRELAASLPDPSPSSSSSSSSSSSLQLLKRAAAAFATAGRHDDAATLLVRLGDTPGLVRLHASAGRWREAALLAAGGGAELARRAHLPRAAALASRGRWAAAAQAYAQAGLPRAASRLLRSAAASAAEAGRYAEAAAWARMRAELVVVVVEEENEQRQDEGHCRRRHHQRQRRPPHQTLDKRLREAEAYWAYALVHDANTQPFAVRPPALVFRAACFVAARGLGNGGGGGGGGGGVGDKGPSLCLRASPGGARRLPHGVSLTESLLAVVRLGLPLGEAEAVRRACEFLLGMASARGDGREEEGEGEERLPPPRLGAFPPLVLTAEQLSQVEMALVCARALGSNGPAAEDAAPCPRCGWPAPLLPPALLRRDAAVAAPDPTACAGCAEPLHVSLITFELLPLVEFRPEPGVSPEQALEMVGRGGYREVRRRRRRGGKGADGNDADDDDADDGAATSTVEPCGTAEDERELDRAWSAAVEMAVSASSSRGGRHAPVLLPAAALRRLRPREVAWRRRAGALQLFRLMDGGAVPVAAGASGHFFFEQEELLAAVMAEEQSFGAAASFLCGGTRGGGRGG
jgi:WD40 repeat protein